MKLYPHNYAEILAALVCLVCLFLKPSVTNRWFIGFLWLTVFVELTAKLLRHHPAYKMMMYNIFGIVECVFYLLYLNKIIYQKHLKRPFKVLALIIVFTGLFWWMFVESIQIYSEEVSMVASIFILLASLTALYSFMTERINIPLLKVYLLILIGLLIFYTGNFLPDASANSAFSNTHSQTFLRVYRLVNGYLNVFMYSCFALAFIVEVSNRTPNHTLPS